MTKTIKSKEEALAVALALAITAPTDEKANECIKMADQFARGMERKDVELAMKNVLDRLVETLEGESDE